MKYKEKKSRKISKKRVRTRNTEAEDLQFGKQEQNKKRRKG